MIPHRRFLGASTLVVSLLVSRAALAQSFGESPQASTQPSEASGPSIEELQRRFLQTNDPEVGLTLARVLVQRNRWLEANAFYREVASLELSPDSSPATSAAKAVASSEREELLKKMPAVLITIEAGDPSAAQVFVNDVRVPANELGERRLVDPGVVRIRGVLGSKRVETVVEVAEGDTRSVRLALGATSAVGPTSAAPAPVVAPPGSAASVSGSSAGRVVGFVAMGIGSAAVVTGGLFGVLAIRDEASLSGRCPDDTCPGRLEPEVDAYESKKTIATVGIVGGALLGLGGAALYLFSDRSEGGERGARAGVFWAGERAGVWGEF